MQSDMTWEGKSMDLHMLVDSLGSFFKKNDFEAIKGEAESGYKIIAHDSPVFKINGHITVSVTGTSEDFTIRLELTRDDDSASAASSYSLPVLFGGGYFLTKKLKSEEAWIKFQKEFWSFAKHAVFSLSGSAGLKQS